MEIAPTEPDDGSASALISRSCGPRFGKQDIKFRSHGVRVLPNVDNICLEVALMLILLRISGIIAGIVAGIRCDILAD